MTHPEATRLREQCDKIMAIRHWLTRIETLNHCGVADMANRLESELLNVEDEIAAAADRLDPPPTRITGQQWIAGLTVPVVRS